jgi:hypothetical protein
MAFELIPSVLAMLVCDQIITEQGTNKKSLIGIFQRVQSPIFPVVIPRFGIYVKMVDVEGTIEFKLRIVKLDDETLLADSKSTCVELVLLETATPAAWAADLSI